MLWCEEHAASDPQMTKSSSHAFSVHSVAMDTQHRGHLIAGQQDRDPVALEPRLHLRWDRAAVPTRWCRLKPIDSQSIGTRASGIGSSPRSWSLSSSAGSPLFSARSAMLIPALQRRLRSRRPSERSTCSSIQSASEVRVWLVIMRTIKRALTLDGQLILWTI